jgi:hypothetical protein
VPGPELLKGRRLVAATAALDGAVWPAGALALRLAPDEVLLVGKGDLSIDDPHAVIEADSSFSAIELSPAEARSLLQRHCDWELPTAVPSLSQGLVAALAVKVWFDQERVLLIVPTPYAHELEERLR